MNDSDVIDDDELPRAFGSYLLLQNFARGGMGDVYLAKSGGIAGLERTCVVKKLRVELSQDREYVTRFVDEARVVVTLNHANICNVFDVGRVGRETELGVVEEYYLAMEYVSGRDLRTVQDRCRKRGRVIDPTTVVHLVAEVLKALDYAHRRRHPVSGEPLNLVHRDVSPQNVLVSYEGEIKLIDFGLAASRLKVERTQPNVVMGKMAYMPPEQARGDQIDARADLFACGVLLYELLTNERYYEGMTANDIWQVAGRGGFVPRAWGGIDPFLQVILGRALHPDPRRRIATCGEFREELMAFGATRNGAGAERNLRELMESLFADEIARERAVMASFGSVTIAAFRTELETTRTHAVTLVPPAATATRSPALDEATLHDAGFSGRGAVMPSPQAARAQITTEEGTPMPAPKPSLSVSSSSSSPSSPSSSPSSSSSGSLHDDPTRLQQRPDLTSDVEARAGRIHDERTVLMQPGPRARGADSAVLVRDAPGSTADESDLDDSQSELTALALGTDRRPLWIGAGIVAVAVVIGGIFAAIDDPAPVVAPAVAVVAPVEAAPVEPAPVEAAPVEAAVVEPARPAEPVRVAAPVKATVPRVNAATARPRPPEHLAPVAIDVEKPSTPSVAPTSSKETVTAAAWHRFFKANSSLPCAKELWSLRVKLSEGAFLRVETDTIRACASTVGERL